ncbi:MAG: polyhydroxybutyrate depolymerase [Myxococcota bacterium]|nr:polyhydroxybutyrate depolymerase [Myxococcota bacterium]MDW8361198.1 PHB depolymerase family esterase [Myxococcales bacterium]
MGRSVRFCPVAWFVLIADGCATHSAVGPDAGSFDSPGNPGDGDADGGHRLEPWPSAACAASSGGAYEVGSRGGTLTHGGRERTFLVRVPPGARAGEPLPVVVVLHGGFGSGAGIASTSGFDDLADREGFVAVFPDGTGAIRTWNGGVCCGSAVRENVDDVGFLVALVEHLGETLCLDRRRVYATGISNGGFLAHRVGCEASHRFVAIAAVAGPEGSPRCEPTRPVGVLHIHGTRDAHAPWDGGEGCGRAGIVFPSVPDTMERWRRRNGCSVATRRVLEQGNGRCDAYEGCAPGGATVLCAVVDGGHSWPGGDPPPARSDERCPDDGPHSTTFDATAVIWSFFRDQSMP